VPGWKILRHRLEYFGICPDCSKSVEER
jgi:Fe2+ or Zn2+ uptake regulation protein